ncbi:MAG: hypothetical protein D6718_04915 [Acidobacteria bacterium]|nr:MAG: hypothetical protein D6718_04915 [Acidobacteriota bacterium]
MRAVRFAWEALRTALTDLLRRPIASALSVASMVVAVALLSAFLLLTQGVRQVVAGWIDQAVVDIYLAPETRRSDVGDLEKELAREPAVRRVEWVPPEQALDEFRRLFPDLGDVDRLLGGNPFPPSLRLVPASADAGGLDPVLERLKDDPRVTGIRFDRDWLAAVARAARAFSWFVLGGAGLLLAGALTTIGSVVRLALDDKRDEVALLRLVGAPFLFVASPVLLSGAILGGTGAALGTLAVDLARSVLLAAVAGGPLAGWMQVLFGAGLSQGTIGALVAGGAVAGGVAAGLAAGPAAFE